VSDDDQGPTIITGGQAGGSGFSAFGADDRKAEQRARRKNLAVKSVAGAVVLLAVAAVAALTSNGSAKIPKGPASAVAPGAGTMPKPAPPQVLFVSATTGYALYLHCDSQPVGEGCQPALYQTTDGTNWVSFGLPPSAPVDPTRWLSLQANGEFVMVSWAGFSAVHQTDGGQWMTVKENLDGSTSSVPGTDFLIGNSVPMVVIHPDNDPTKVTAVTFRPPLKVVLPGVTGGTLADGKLWMRDPVDIGLSANGGVNWNVTPLPDGDAEAPPVSGDQNYLALLTGPDKDAKTGLPGAGGVLPAGTAYFSTDAGASWDSPTTLTGAKVNALCTVYLNDQSLLGVSADGTGLLRLGKDKTAFVPVSFPQVTTPFCLSAHGKLVWGAAAANQIELSTDSGHSWNVVTLPATARASATPSPTPSVAK
jgi:hypothetical protein